MFSLGMLMPNCPDLLNRVIWCEVMFCQGSVSVAPVLLAPLAVSLWCHLFRFFSPWGSSGFWMVFYGFLRFSMVFCGLLMAHLDPGPCRTFCDSCYLGVVSAGDASGEGSELRRVMLQQVLRSSVFDEFSKNNPQAYLATPWQSRLGMPLVPYPTQWPNTLLKDVRKMSERCQRDVKDKDSRIVSD